MADNGIIHVIDRVLVPPGSGIGGAPENVTPGVTEAERIIP